MSIPRLSIDALSARLFTEKQSFCAIVEGRSDRIIVTNWVEDNFLPVSIYSIDEIEIDLPDDLRRFGGNKGRVIALFNSPLISEFADKNAIGFIDRDCDFIMNDVVELVGVYYTRFCCLLSEVITESALNDIFRKSMGKKLPEGMFEEIATFSEKYFRLRAKLRELSPQSSLPKIEGYVRKLSQGGFDWHGYLIACQQAFGGKITGEDLLDFISLQEANDVREAVHIHSTVEYIWRLFRKDGLINNEFRQDEIYHLIHFYYSSNSNNCSICNLVRQKYLALDHTR